MLIADVDWVALGALRELVLLFGATSLERLTLHTIFIGLHALAATISFLSGGFVIFSSKFFSNRRLFSLYFWSLIGMVFFLACAMIVWWSMYTTLEQVAFGGLFGLAMYLVYRGVQARSLLQLPQRNRGSTSTHHIGFTLISLFEGFIIVALINAGAPGWLVAGVAIGGVLVGRRAINMAESRRGAYISKASEKPL